MVDTAAPPVPSPWAQLRRLRGWLASVVVLGLLFGMLPALIQPAAGPVAQQSGLRMADAPGPIAADPAAVDRAAGERP